MLTIKYRDDAHMAFVNAIDTMKKYIVKLDDGNSYIVYGVADVTPDGAVLHVRKWDDGELGPEIMVPSETVEVY